ncbi:Ger(x)C family germination protein [Hydrogenispora ethanolica]|uniref:Ger(X)C family germination protein n=1 Tax=Hydrogenispora ethanolica TaxID=1082276 RepID=A0A4R1SAJ2_HYDET|nr:Ger(x)C family spore germination protein [Hydrogenispora ethanolica]TCL76379.1 Ger(x)C family germination protein [Hydrogenispora ethanolica]
MNRTSAKRTTGIKTTGLILAMILAIPALLGGCWDYREIDDQIIISGAAVDYDRESRGISLTVEIALPTASDKESSFTSKIYQAKGQNIPEAIVALHSKAGRRLLWSHSKILILGAGIMENERLFIGTMDWVKRNGETRETMWMVFSEEKTAGEILQRAEPQTEKIISYYLDRLFLAAEAETFISMPYSEVMYDLSSPSACIHLPAVRLEDSDGGKLPFINGTAVFRRTKVAGWLDGKQTRILALLLNKLNRVVFVLRPSGHSTLPQVSLRTSHCQTAIEPVLSQNTLRMKVRVKIEAQIAEIDGVKEVFKPAALKKLKEEAQRMIAAEIMELLNLLKEKYQSDVLGFGSQVENKYPQQWRRIRSHWESVYARIPAVVRVELNVTGSEQSMAETKEGR